MFGTSKHFILWICTGLLVMSCGCSCAKDTHDITTSTSKTDAYTTGAEVASTTADSITPSTHHTQSVLPSSTQTSSSTATTQTVGSTTTSVPTVQTTIPRPTSPTTMRDGHCISAPLLAQRPDYPSGCESVSAVMLLQYWGEDITVDEFIDNHLPKSTRFYTENGRYYGPSPYEYFIGNPRTEQAYGCMAPAIQHAINHYYGDDRFTQIATGSTLPELCDKYIANNQPVLVWVTIGMVETYPGGQWYFEDGTLFTWPVNEHCMMLVGYDDTYYYFNDPYTGKLKKYPHWICEDRYSALGKQAVVIVK